MTKVKIQAVRKLRVLVVALALTTPLAAADRTEHVQFAQGTSSKVIKGTIKGYDGVQYVVGAKAGQTMTVSLKTSNGANQFNIWAPGKTPGNDEALFVGGTNGNKAKIKLPSDGDYVVQVYLMRSVARRGTPVNYTLTVTVLP